MRKAQATSCVGGRGEGESSEECQATSCVGGRGEGRGSEESPSYVLCRG